MPSSRSLILPLLVLVLGLLATAAAAILLERAEEARRQARFETLAYGAVGAIESRMLAQVTLLRGAAGFFNASDDVSREDFAAFVARLRLQRYYPGILGIGYAEFASADAGADALKLRGSRTWGPQFRHWPGGDRPGYSAIIYLEPMNRRNEAAIGFDMMSEPTRERTMGLARSSGVARLSGKVKLVQEIDPVKQPGFLIYLPLYRDHRDGRMEVSPEDLYGWVYSPFRAVDLFGGIFEQHDLGGVDIEIFDGSPTEDRLLYRSGGASSGSHYRALLPLEIAGHRWLIRAGAERGFEGGSLFSPALLATATGLLISLLVAILTLQQMRARVRTERQVQLRTAELQEANKRLHEEAAGREAAEAQIRQMQKVEAVGQLTGGIAHDFNNMLAIIIGNLDIAQRRISETQRVAKAVANAREGAERAAELTRRLLAFGRKQALSPKVVDPNKVVSDMSELLRRTLGEHVRLETVLAGGMWRAFADLTQLENALLNLAINSRDAMPNGGALTIETANCHLDEAYAARQGDLEPGQYVLIAISDTGEGMSEELASRAIEPFFTTKEVGRGTGLGLSQVYGFVKQSGGHLKIYSEPGQGTTVKIYLPRSFAANEAERTAPAPEKNLENGDPSEVILVVEDDDRVRDYCVECLRDLGYAVLAADNGVEALALLGAHPEVRLLFTDVVMPGMNGRELADAALKLRPGLRVLFTTGYTRNAIVHHGRLDDGVALLQKPYTVSDLATRVREQLDACSTEERSRQ